MLSRAGALGGLFISTQNRLIGDQDAHLAELAFAKCFNIYPDLSMYNRSGGYDAMLGKWRVDVKATHLKTGQLLVRMKDNPDVDVYVLAIIGESDVTFPGWAYKNDVCNPDRVSDPGNKGQPCYAMPQCDLTKWNEA